MRKLDYTLEAKKLNRSRALVMDLAGPRGAVRLAVHLGRIFGPEDGRPRIIGCFHMLQQTGACVIVVVEITGCAS